MFFLHNKLRVYIISFKDTIIFYYLPSIYVFTSIYKDTLYLYFIYTHLYHYLKYLYNTRVISTHGCMRLNKRRNRQLSYNTWLT